MRSFRLTHLARSLVVFLVCLVPLTAAQAEGPHFDARIDAAGFDTAYRIQGDWLFAWDAFLSPQDALEAYRQQTLPLVPIPARWETFLPHDDTNPFHHGKATYVAHLTLPDDAPTDLMLSIQAVQDAYRVIWVPMNAPHAAIEIAQEGNLTGPALSAVRGLSFPFPARGDGLLVLQVRKTLFSEGGARNAPEIQRAAPKIISLSAHLIKNGLIIGVLALIVFRLAMFWPMAKQDAAAIALMCASLVVLYRVVAVANVPELLFGAQIHPLRLRLELATLPLLGGLLVALNQSLFDNFMPRGVRIAAYGTSLIVFGCVLLVPLEWVTKLVPLYQIHMITAFALSAVFTALAIRRREPGSYGLGFVTLCAVMAGGHDVIAGNTDGYNFMLAEFAILLVMVYYSHLITNRISETLNQAAVLQLEKDRLEKAHTDALHLARHDHLTGLLNRQSFDHFLSEAQNTAARAQAPLSVVLFDIDHFKSINDTHGHQVGDAVLQALAARLIGLELRKADKLCRYGGEEFALILPDCSEAEGVATADRLRAAISARPMLESNPEISITCSFGVADTTCEDILMHADAALYEAKSAGRNCVRAAFQSPAIAAE